MAYRWVAPGSVSPRLVVFAATPVLDVAELSTERVGEVKEFSGVLVGVEEVGLDVFAVVVDVVGRIGMDEEDGDLTEVVDSVPVGNTITVEVVAADRVVAANCQGFSSLNNANV